MEGTRSGEEISRSVKEILNKANSSRHCTDPLSCANHCTAVGQQIKEVSASAGGLLGTLGEVATERSFEDNCTDPYANYDPESEVCTGNSGMDACVLSTVEHSRESLACGLIQCQDAHASARTGSSCNCGNTTISGKAYTALNLCVDARCPEGMNPVKDLQTGVCSCEAVGNGGWDGGVEPRPLPTWGGDITMSQGVQTWDKDGSIIEGGKTPWIPPAKK